MRRLLAFTGAVIAVILVFSLISCDTEAPVGPDANADVSGSAARLQASPALEAATGQGTTWYERGEDAGWMVIAVSARQMPDGSASGNFHWQVHTREWGGRVFVKVSCLTITGNEARVVGQASQAGNPANVGKWMGLYIEDNGEGADAPPDRVFHRWLGVAEEEALLFCAGPRPEDPAPREVAMGSFQVR